MNQANGGRSGAVCAVPVLPATWTPLIWPGLPVPFLTTSTIIWVSWLATSGVTAWCSDSGLVSDTVFRSAVRTFCTRYGFITSPPLAIPAATIAICSGVAWTSNWPIADCATCGRVRVGRELAGDRAQLRQLSLAEAELLRLLAERVRAQVETDRTERGVAGRSAARP